MTMRIAALTLTLAATVAPMVRAQGFGADEIAVRKLPFIPRPEYTLKAQATLVEVGVVVRDNVGRVVDGLIRESFHILDNGKPREITSFSVQKTVVAADGSHAARRRYIALVFDDILVACPMQCQAIKAADWMIMQKAAERYVREGLAPGDRISVIALFDGQVQTFTDDRELLAKAISGLRPHFRLQKRAVETLGVLGDIVDYLGQFRGERVLVVASGGLSAGRTSSYQNELVAHALRAGVTINGVDTRGLTGISGREDESMYRMTQQTGGLYFRDNNNMLRGLRDTAAPAVKYILGFAQPDVHDGRFHPLKVKVTGHSEVAARAGYFAPSPEEDSRATPGPLDRAALSDESLSQLHAHATVQAANSAAPPGLAGINVTEHVELKTLGFRAEGGRHAQQLTFVAVLFDRDGAPVAGGQAVIDFNMRDATLERLQAAGMNCTLSLAAPQGSYRLRTVVRDETGAIAAASERIEMRL